MDGSAGPQAAVTQKFVHILRGKTALPVLTWDERLTSYQADLWMNELAMTAQQRSRQRDTLAATAILQSYLARDREPGESESPPSL